MEEHLTTGRSLIHDANHAQIDRRGALCVRLSRRATADQQHPLPASRTDVVDSDRALPVGLAAGIEHLHHQQFVVGQPFMAYGADHISGNNSQLLVRLRV